MSDAELNHLVAMANDIARNLAFNADAEDLMVAHLQRYWPPVLRARIREHVAEGGEGLSDLAMAAVKRLPES